MSHTSGLTHLEGAESSRGEGSETAVSKGRKGWRVDEEYTYFVWFQGTERESRQTNFSQVRTRKNTSKIRVVHNWAGISGKAVNTSLLRTRPDDPRRFPPWKEAGLGNSFSPHPQWIEDIHSQDHLPNSNTSHSLIQGILSECKLVRDGRTGTTF